MQVTATGPLLEASNATLSSVVENKKIIDLPLNNRNIYSLLRLVPGITPSTPNSESDFFTSTIRFSINGGKESLNDIQLDGVTAMCKATFKASTALRPSPRWKAFKSSACRPTPTRPNMAQWRRPSHHVTKSGSNEFHGSAFEFLRNSAMDAKSFFLNRTNRTQSSFQQHQYGVSTGGPVKKDQTFFFALYEKRLVKSGSFSQFTVPSAQQLTATFPTRDTHPQRRPAHHLRSLLHHRQPERPHQVHPNAVRR